MSRKIASSALALTGLLIGLGAFGHSFIGRRSLDLVVLGGLALVLSLTIAATRTTLTE